MKNKTFIRLASLLIAVFMLMSMFVLGASAEKKVVYDEENTTVEYEDGVVTVTLSAEKLAKLIKNRAFTLSEYEDLLPNGVYRMIHEHTKAALRDFIINLANAGVFTYDEVLKVFAGQEDIMKKYINLDLCAAFFTADKLTETLVELYNEGEMDTFFNADGVRDALYEKLGVQTDLDVLADFNAFLDAVKDVERDWEVQEEKAVQVLLPMREIIDKLAIRNSIDAASGTTLKTKIKAVIEQVLMGEIDEIYVNGELVYENLELDHNVLQKVLLQGLPSVEYLTYCADGDTLADYVVRTEGENVEMEFELILKVKGDTTPLNEQAERLNQVFTYIVEDSGTIDVYLTFNGIFAENYTKVLNCADISDERKLEYLGLYTADAAAFRAQLEGAKFDEFLADAKAAGVDGSEKVDTHLNKILTFRNYLLRASQYETAFTTLDDCYVGTGEFIIYLTEVVPLDVIADDLHSRFSSIDEVMNWLKQEDHVIDTVVDIYIEDFFNVSFYDEDKQLLYSTYLPSGTDLGLVFGADELDGYGTNGWFTANGTPVTETPDFDLELYPCAVEKDIEVTKIWDDDDNRDGVRPDEVSFDILANGQTIGYVELGAYGCFYSFSTGDYDETVGRARGTRSLGDGLNDPLISPNEGDPNAWSGTVYGLPLKINGQEIDYTFTETNTFGYNVSYDYDQNGNVTITNTYEPELTGIRVNKVWNDGSNRDAVRPLSIEVNLLADGQICKTVSVYAPAALETEGVIVPDDAVIADIAQSGNWVFSFSDLPVYRDNGVQIVYTLDEEPVAGYTTSIDGFTITNTYEPETVVISGTKVWNDPDTKDVKRPEFITVILYANGVEVDRMDVRGQGDTWDFEFDPQPKNFDGVEIVYTIDEVDVEGYNKEVNGYEIVNSGVFAMSMFLLAAGAAAGGTVATVRVIRKKRDQD